MKFQIVFLAALVGAVAAAPAGAPVLEERQCLAKGAECDTYEQCCSGLCFFGDLPRDPATCG